MFSFLCIFPFPSEISTEICGLIVQHLMCRGVYIVASVNFDNAVTGSEFPSRVNLSAVS